MILLSRLAAALLIFAGCGHAAVAPQDPACASGREGSPVCCTTLTAAADRLLASGARDAAIASYEDARNRCPQFAPVRRRLFLAQHPELAPAPAAPPITVQLEATFTLDVRPDLRVVWRHAYVDGEPLQLVRQLASGPHLYEAELYLATAGGDGPVYRLAAGSPFVVPAALVDAPGNAGGFTVRASDRGGAEPPPRRVTIEVTPAPFTRLAAAPPPAPLPPVTALLSPPAAAARLLTSPAPLAALQGQTGFAVLKVCVDGAGVVDDTKLMHISDAAATGAVLHEVRSWRYRPYVVAGVPTRFCAPLRYGWGER
jgi:hypothetical protein